MLKVESVDCRQFEAIKDILCEIPGSWTESDWRRLFSYQWQRDEEYCGLALKDGDKAVGFIGMIFSQRRINLRDEKFCNLTAWIVEKEYRSRSLSLLLPLFRMQDYTITDLTPSRKVYLIEKKLGFKDLDAKCRILLPLGRRLRQLKAREVFITHDTEEIEKLLSREHLRILYDHKPYQCSHLLVRANDDYCYIIFTKCKRKRIPYAHIHYISNLNLFSLTYVRIRKTILKNSNSCFIMIDSRFVKTVNLPLSFCIPFRAPKLYLSSRLDPDQIDNLYSEIVLMNLGSHPRLKYLLRSFVAKFFRKK
jgi:hypothetical protein